MAYSDFNYIAPTELAALIPTMSSVTNEALAATFISTAEVIIDAFAGPGPRFYPDLTGQVKTAMASGATTLPASIFGDRRPNYWARGGVFVKILDSTSGSLVDQERLVVASDNEQVTLVSAFNADGGIPAGTQFRFRQVSAFPRIWDTNPLGDPDMPWLLKRAVAAQVDYGIQAGSEGFGMGDPDLVTDEAGDITSRTYGSGYSEARDARRRDGLAVFVAPQARVYLRQLLNSTGKLR